MQVGKTTAADHLVARHGFVKYALADPIKRIAEHAFGWDGAKDASGRRLLQEIGTVGRHYDPELWLERFAARLKDEAPERPVVDDVRLALEVDYLERLGFMLVRITRPPDRIARQAADEAPQGHETETELDRVAFAQAIDNTGSIADLCARVDALLSGPGGRVVENRKAPP